MISKNKISFYENKLDKKGLPGTIELALHRIKTGKKKKEIEKLRATTDKATKEKLKGNLSAVTFSGLFEERFDEKIIEHSGLITLDFDYVLDVEYLREKLIKWEYTFACWLSPSGTGFKALVKIKQPDKHREHFFALEHEWKDMGFQIDKACKNESRLCYESYDPDIYINQESKVYTKFAVKEYDNPTAVLTEKERESDEYRIFENLKKWAAKNGDQFVEGNRNNFVMKMAGACARFGIGESATANFIRSDFVMNDKTFSDKELITTVKSAFNANRGKLGSQIFEKDKVVDKKSGKPSEEPIKIFDTEQQVADIVRAKDVRDKIKKIYDEGYVGAETTHIPDLDKIWKLSRGESNLFSGMGNSGKSTFLRQVMLIKSLKSNTKWVIFAPEDFPAEQFFWELVEMLMAQNCTPGSMSRPMWKLIEKAIEFINEHFYYIEASQEPSPEYVLAKFMECVILYGCDGCLVDPYNQLYHDYADSGGRDDKYLEKTLPIFHKFAKAKNIFWIWVVHPKALQMKKGEQNYPCPEVFDLAGGAMWNNKIDNIVMIHRPLGQSHPEDPTVEVHTKKIRYSYKTGKRGIMSCYYNWRTRRYIFPFMEDNPDVHPLNDFINNSGIEIKKSEEPVSAMKPNKEFDEQPEPKPKPSPRNYYETEREDEELEFNFNNETIEDEPF